MEMSTKCLTLEVCRRLKVEELARSCCFSWGFKVFCADSRLVLVEVKARTVVSPVLPKIESLTVPQVDVSLLATARAMVGGVQKS